ncbi:MAG: hypothetical protein ACFFDY_00530 [Candidatus Thorarchaeota archaeon]
MLSLNATQQAVVASAKKPEISWLFEIDTDNDGAPEYRYSTKAKSFGGNSYIFKILKFTPIGMQKNSSEYGLIAPNKFTFTIDNHDDALTPSDFNGAAIKVRLIVDDGTNGDTEIASWEFEVINYEGIYKEITLVCRDWLQKYLDGDYPNTSLIKDLWYSDDPKDDNVCVPIMYGTPYFPIRSAYITDQRYYILGPSSPTYTITKIRSPRDWPSKSEWSSGSYTFTQSNKTGSDGNTYKAVQFIIADSDNDGSADANGLFVNGEEFLDVPCKYTRSDTNSTTNPADIIEAILLDFGIPSAKIDSTTQNSAASSFTSWGLTWNMSLWYKMSRKKLLAKLLAMCHLELIIRDKIYFKIHSKTSQGTIDNSYILRKKERGKGTFSIKNLSVKNQSKDSGYGAFQESDEPIDKLQKFLVPAKASTNDISNDVIECDYIQDSQDAQKITQLALQRKLLAFQAISFLSKGTALAYEVDDVITIANDANYGAEGTTYDVLIDKIIINKDLSIKFECTRFSDSLDDWGDLSPSAITIVSDDSSSLYSPVVCGPDTTGITGSQVPNALPGRLRIGDDSNYIVIDPDDSGDRYVASGKTDFTTTGNGFIIGIDHSDSDKVKLYLGNTTDYMYWDGSNLVISGNITATTGNIGGWTITSTTLHSSNNIVLDSGNKAIYINDTTYGNEGIQLEYNNGYPRVYVGDGGNNYFKYDGTKIQWKGANTELDGSGNLTCTGGTIGGWTIGATTISSTNITIDSDNERIRSTNYVSGSAGAGFTLEPELLEVGNIACRGIIRTAVFQKDIISAIGGNLLVSKGSDVLDADMNSLDSSNLSVEGNESFAVGDILRIKDGIDDEWLEITDNTYDPIYTVIRDLAGSYVSDYNPEWGKGATVVNYGANGDGLIHMTASEANAPFISVLTHAGAPYTTITTRLRIGNLNGFLGYSSDKYGIAIGETNKYLKYDPTGGLVIQGTVNIIGSATLGDGSNYSGTITLSIADGQGDCYIAAGKSDFTNTDNGFILGVDDSDSDKVKFYLGNSTNYFNWDGTNIIINVASTDAITVKSGGDIVLEATAANPGRIKFVGTTYETQFGSFTADGSAVNFMAQTDNAVTLSAYNGSNYFSQIQWYSRSQCSVGCIEDSNNQATIACDRSSAMAQAYFYMRDGGTTKTLEMRYDSVGGSQYFAPNDNEEWDLGNSTYYWKDIYARNLYLKDSDAHPIIQITAAHATDYDPQIKFATDATPTVKFSMGVDGSDDKFKIYSGDGIGGTTEFVISSSGTLYLGDDSGGNMTGAGIVINQGTSDDFIMCFKSTDIAHGYTAVIEEDSYGLFSKYSSTNGGLDIYGICEAGATTGLAITGFGGTAPDETTASGSDGIVEVNAWLDGGDYAADYPSGDDNVFVVKLGKATACFIVKADGDIYYNGADQGSFDSFEDALACRDLSYNLSNQLVKVLKYNKKKLNDMGVIAHTICENGKEDIFVSTKGMTMLQLGAIGELYKVCNYLCSRLGITYEEARKEV